MDDPLIRILLLEGDLSVTRVVQENLRDVMEGQFICTSVPTVEEMLEQVRAAPYDVILLDLSLPDSQGLDTFLTVQAQARMTPILILTGLDSQTLVVQVMRAGAQDYIIKSELSSNSLARAIRYAIERHRLQTELHGLSVSDSLTGLYNRRGFLMLANEQLKLVHRSSQGLLLFLCVVDGMGPGSDTLGDQMLIETAGLLRATFRGSDIIARLSADEFVVLAIGTLPATAELLQARMQANLNKHNAGSSRAYELSLSIGMAYAAPKGETTMEELISTADKEIYIAKRDRRKARSE